MRVWVVQISEALPTDNGMPRLQRTGLLADQLHRRGHDVVFWATTFQYRAKTYRADRETTLDPFARYRVRLLHARGYDRNISLDRIRYHREVARRFAEAIEREATPDVILCSYPTIELSEAAVAFGRQHGIPVVLDVRDMWPDIFLRLVPSPLRPMGVPLARLALRPLTAAARRAFAGATGITGNTAEMVQWGLAYAGRGWGSADAAFPHGYAPRALDDASRANALAALRERGVAVDRDDFRVVFFGLFARAPEFDTVLEAAKRLQSVAPRIQFLLCGTGPREAGIRERSRSVSNVQVPGWIDGDAIWALMERSHVGLLCYHSTFDFEASIPNKPIEYMAGGLPVVSSLTRGVLHDLLAREQCGLSYANGAPDELVNHLRRLHDDETLRSAMAQRARETFGRLFEADRVYGDFAAHLERVAGNGLVRREKTG